MGKADGIFGNGFFIATLVNYARSTFAGAEPVDEIANVLKDISSRGMKTHATQRAECTAMITGAIAKSADLLIRALKYDEAEAQGILY
jgi:hypothetical protein